MVFSKGNSTSSTIAVLSAHRPLKLLPVTVTGLIVVLLVVVLVGQSFTHAMPLLSPGANRHNVEFKRYCSSSLSDVMFSICGGNFNSLFNRNHDRVSEGKTTSSMKRLTPDADEELFFRPTSLGPVHECCRRPCGYTELKQYCSTD